MSALSGLAHEMADTHRVTSLEGSTDVSLADGQSIREKNNMALESEKQVETENASPDVHTNVPERVVDEKGVVETSLANAGSGEVSQEKKPKNEEEEEEEQIEYPAKWRLALITTALCLSVFCMALVWQLSLFLGYPTAQP